MADRSFEALAHRAFARESRHNELRISQLRLVCFLATTLITTIMWFVGGRGLGDVLAMIGAVAVAAALWFVVSRFYRPWMRFLLPGFDAAVIWYLLDRRIAAEGLTPGTSASAIATLALLSASGGFRFDRKTAAWTTALALFCSLLLVGRGFGTSLPFVYAGLLGVGLLSMWQADSIRRVIQGEQGRALLTRMLPKSVVDQMYTDPKGLATRPNSANVSVVVTDLRGFTAISEELGPERTVEVLNELHGTLASIVNKHGGIVDKFMGDGMLAVFGAPKPLRAHAVRAVAAAMEMRSAVFELNLLHPERAPLRIGIGVHSGPVVSGIIGGGSKFEFTVIGDTVNIASRLESMTKELGVEVLISSETAQASGAGPFVDKGAMPIRGRAKPMNVCAPATSLRLPEMEEIENEVSNITAR